MITELTQEQRDAIPHYVEKWTRIGLSTERADLPVAETAALALYAQLGMDAPRIEWIDSFGALSSIAVRSAVGDKPWSETRYEVRFRVEPTVWSEVRSAVGSAVGSATWSAVGSGVRDAVGDKVWAAVENGFFCGDNYAFYDYMRDELGLIAETEPIMPLITLVQACGGVLPTKDVCYLIERPIRIALDEQGRLHHESEKAIEYPDGWGLHYIHGERVE